jgi:hypothetical protein
LALHIIKLCVGAESVDDLAAWQASRYARSGGRLVHTTRMVPKQQDAVLDGGSLYWVIKGVVQVRQRIIGFDQGTKEDGTPCCLFVLDRELVPVRPVPRRPFQGWRYLKADDAPVDLADGDLDETAHMPPKMRRELVELGLL